MISGYTDKTLCRYKISILLGKKTNLKLKCFCFFYTRPLKIGKLSTFNLIDHWNIYFNFLFFSKIDNYINSKSLLIFHLTSQSRIFHFWADVTITGDWMQSLGLCSTFRAFEQEGIFIVPHLLWHRATVFQTLSKGLPHSVASYDTHGNVGGPILTRIFMVISVHYVKQYIWFGKTILQWPSDSLNSKFMKKMHLQ
jgi:hypothetical protein